jgi:hypothetical protein
LVRVVVDLTSSFSVTKPKENMLGLWKVYFSMHMMETFINSELGSFAFELSRQVVMEKLLGSKMIRPHLPYYYLLLVEVKVQHTLVQGLKIKLDLVKGVQSKEKLARKGVLLNFVVKKKKVRIRALGKVFNTNPVNISANVKRRKQVEASG